MNRNATQLNLAYLDELKPKYTAKGYPIPKWIIFCETMLHHGWGVFLYRAQTSVSKYVYIKYAGLEYKIRFSDHKPAREREEIQDCDYFVGIGNKQSLTTQQLLRELLDEEIVLK